MLLPGIFEGLQGGLQGQCHVFWIQVAFYLLACFPPSLSASQVWGKSTFHALAGFLSDVLIVMCHGGGQWMGCH